MTRQSRVTQAISIRSPVGLCIGGIPELPQHRGEHHLADSRTHTENVEKLGRHTDSACRSICLQPLLQDQAFPPHTVHSSGESDGTGLEIDIRPSQTQGLSNPSTREQHEIPQVNHVEALKFVVASNCDSECCHIRERNRFGGARRFFPNAFHADNRIGQNRIVPQRHREHAGKNRPAALRRPVTVLFADGSEKHLEPASCGLRHPHVAESRADDLLNLMTVCVDSAIGSFGVTLGLQEEVCQF
nr:hypothetical protein [Glaciihabitans sp. dw_435]